MTRDMTGKRVLVMGAGISGRAAASFLARRGAHVVLADDMPKESLPPESLALEKEGVRVAGGSIAVPGEEFDFAVLSPGISVNDPRVANLKSSGVEVMSEIELAFRHLDVPVIAVTGTNGKTTVTKLIGRMLEAAGKKTFVGGNVGNAMLEAVGDGYDYAVVEISSFQLEAVTTFKPRVSVWLNLTGDHLDRHGDLETYALAKAEILAGQGPGDAAVVNRDDDIVWRHARATAATVLPYSVKSTLGVGAWLEGDELVLLMPGTDGRRFPASPMALQGLFNLGNVMSAILAVAALGIDPGPLMPVVREFKGLGHRLEKFLEWRGITFIDDSKATNVDAAVKAVETVRGPLIWLAGGVEKGSDYLPLRKPLEERAKLAVLVGPNVDRMAEELEGAVPIVKARDWPDAAGVAVGSAVDGDSVLLAPACSSFDFFKSYAERGDVFQRLVREETSKRGGGDA